MNSRMLSRSLCILFVALSLSQCGFLGDMTSGLFPEESTPKMRGRGSIQRSEVRDANSSPGKSSTLLGSERPELDAGLAANGQGLVQQQARAPLASARLSELPGTGNSETTLPGADIRSSGTTDSNVPSSISGLEVTWKIPEKSAEGFVLYYGSEPSRLDSHIRVASDELETLPDAETGAVYRYIIPDVPTQGPLFVALSSYTGSEEGPVSDPIEVKPSASYFTAGSALR